MPRILASEVNSSNPVNSVGPRVDELAVGGQVGVRVLAGRGVGLGALALLGHQPAEALFVDATGPASAAISRVRSIGKP